MKAQRGSPWEDPAKLQFLRENWGKISTQRIADALGVSKNGVISKAHRIGLDNLGSPIGKGGAGHLEIRRESRSPYKRGSTPRPVRSKQAQPVAAPAKTEASAAVILAAPVQPAPPPKPFFVLPPPRREKAAGVAAAADAVPIGALQPGQCRYPVTPDRVSTGQHRFCGQVAEPERPYCPEHAKKCSAGRWSAHAAANVLDAAAPKTRMPDFGSHVRVAGGFVGNRR
jgi:GcrA cell cycle regulator